jgi:tRNA1Val (adenine37-N6)-methyltransferase
LRRLKNRKESQNLETIDLKPGERLDDLQRNGFKIIQDPEKFCFGMDAVLLSGFASAPEGGRVLDLGTGTGIIPILMAAKTSAKELIGLEIQDESAEMANRSVLLNNLQTRVKIVRGDIKEADHLFEAASFDVVTSNPPYMIGGHGLQNPDAPKAIARHEIMCDLEDVIRAAARCLRPGGKFYMVHRPFRLTEIMVLMHEYKVEPKRMRLVYPFVNKEPSMVLIEGTRGGKSRITVEEPLIIYEEQVKYTSEIYDIYGY